jgi:hypothetical protein
MNFTDETTHNTQPLDEKWSTNNKLDETQINVPKIPEELIEEIMENLAKALKKTKIGQKENNN